MEIIVHRDIAQGQRGVCGNQVRRRVDDLQHLALIADFPAGIPVLLPIDGEGQLFSLSAPLDVDRAVQVVLEPEILVRALRDGRVRGRVHIGHDHGVVRPLGDLQLRQQDGIVQRGGYLADAASHAVHHLVVHEGPRHIVSVLRGEGRHAVQHGELVPGIQDRAVDQVAAVGDVLAPVEVGGAVGGSERAQHVLHPGKLLGAAPGLGHLHHQRDAAGLAVPSAGQKLMHLVEGGLHIQGVPGVSAHHPELSVLPDQSGVHRLLIVLGALLDQDVRKPLEIKGQLQRVDQVLPLQVLEYLVPLYHIPMDPHLQGLGDDLLIGPGDPQLPCAHGHFPVLRVEQRDFHLPQGLHIGLHGLRRLLGGHAGEIHLPHENPVLDGVSLLCRRGHAPQQRTGQETGQKAAFPYPFSHSLHPL